MKFRITAAIGAAGLVLGVAGSAFAHPGEAPVVSRIADDNAFNSAKEDHRNGQHGGGEGHLDPKHENVELVGAIDLFAGGEQPGRIGDVSAKGNYAYLTNYYEPACSRGGVQVVDISNPANIKRGPFIPSHQGTYAGEGSQVVSINNASFKGDVLIYQNEICPDYDNGVGGVTLVDVTNPLKPKKLVEGFGDFTNPGKSQRRANEVHSAFGWTNLETNRTYVVMTDNEEATDTDIIEITNPTRPRWVADYDFAPDSKQAPGAVHGDNTFIHDEIVKRIGGRDIALLSYWDGGYVKADFTDPANATFIADTEYAETDPFHSAYTPEGNGHQAEFTRDDEMFIATDEDFDPFRVEATIVDGPYAGHPFTGVNGDSTPPVDLDTAITGGTRFLGLACTSSGVPAADAGHLVAVIERGVCDFQVKIDIAAAKGYSSVIIFNRTGLDGCEALITMLAAADIPAIFVSRTDGFRILGASLDGYTCDDTKAATGTAAPAAGGAGSTVDVHANYDGWGYVHLFDANTMADLDQYSIPEGQSPAYAEGFGDLSVHEVATDPDEDLAYLSYYSGGFRVLSYEGGQLDEVGAYIDPEGNNFWGVEVHKHPNGQKYVLASDRDSGLWIFRYTGG